MIPSNLGPKAIAMFDGLLSRGLLFYAETQAEPVSHDGFQFEFRVSPVLKKKPILARDAPGRSQAQGPFVDPDPDFVVAEIGTGHILELNMHCIHRPAFVLHTRLFAPQTDDLDATDIAAVRAVIENLRGSLGPQMAIYNCGFDAGSSQGHKHMQISKLISLACLSNISPCGLNRAQVRETSTYS
ncbi:hypothetical protein Daus18300_003466 [Diaporthe australafricana]|uniref:Ap4A phosphorylase 1/2 N-terminal domain-containing protein n=1 Tax=Diaporthe australafricana TaxID=127596 RepID=A0ABR3XES3_9PEZI